jgi:hypothetical protein
VAHGWNLKKPLIEVLHADLERVSEGSYYKSWCPSCEKGVLLLSRPQPLYVFALDRLGRCTLCGQGFWFTDEKVEYETFAPDQPRFLTPEVIADHAKSVAGLPDLPSDSPTLWDRITDSER